MVEDVAIAGSVYRHHGKLDLPALFQIQVDRFKPLPRVSVNDVRVVYDGVKGDG